jgi:putative addiction module killer protein
LVVYEIVDYISMDGRDVVKDWRSSLRDTTARIAIGKRLNRVALGNFGDHKFCRDGVWELRIDVGPGYRVYYALAGTKLVLLLGGGDKRTQAADIDRACECWREWQRRD